MKTCILHTRITFRIFEVEPQRLQVSARRGTRQRCAKYGLWRSSPSIGTSSRRPALSACELLIADSVVTGEVYLCSSFRIHSKHRNNSMNSTGNAKLTCIYANFHSLQFTTQNILSIVATKHTFSQLNTRLDNNMLAFLRESAIIVYYFRDRSMLQNAYLLANFCADTAENEPNIATKLTIICQPSAKLPRSEARGPLRRPRLPRGSEGAPRAPRALPRRHARGPRRPAPRGVRMRFLLRKMLCPRAIFAKFAKKLALN